MTIRVRRASPNDAAAHASVMGDPAVYPGTLRMPYADEEAWRVWLTDMCAPGKHDLPLVAELNGEVLGCAGLHPAGAAMRRRHVMALGIVVAPQAQGQGVGSALMLAMCDYADRWAGVLRLELSVYTDNAVALRLYRKFGFVIEGTMRGYSLRDGRYVNTHAMARFHPDPPAIMKIEAGNPSA